VDHEELLRRHHPAPVRGAAVPALHTVLVTCMDARIDPAALFGIQPGEVHVLRNAGGVVTDDVVRSVVISQRKLRTRDVLVVAHTGCGMATFTDDELSDELAGETGTRPPWSPRTFTDPAEEVARGVAALRRDPHLRPDGTVRGFVLDIGTLELTEVAA
jgi:carbonic anhydrase